MKLHEIRNDFRKVNLVFILNIKHEQLVEQKILKLLKQRFVFYYAKTKLNGEHIGNIEFEFYCEENNQADFIFTLGCFSQSILDLYSDYYFEFFIGKKDNFPLEHYLIKD